ncbi:MAG: hypothetical protein R2795_19455 [Saprospiraceae bacterium]
MKHKSYSLSMTSFLLKHVLPVFLVLLAYVATLKAEGTYQVAPTANDLVMLLIGDSNYGNFATPNGPEASRIYVRLNAPEETLYIGLSREYLQNGSPASTGAYSFQIKRASDNAIVHGPFSVNSFVENLASWEDAAGPAVLNNGVGYSTDDARYRFAPGEAGLYYIEFINCDFIGLWDFTVGLGDQPVTGRVYSKSWAFRTPSLANTAPECVWDREFNGELYSYTSDGFVSKIDFDGSGFQGLSFTMAFNSKGPGQTGNIEQDRMSLPNANISADFAEHLIFLAEPDPILFPSGVCGSVAVAPYFSCTGVGTYCLDVSVTRSGLVEIVLDINQNGTFEAAIDRRLVHSFVDGQPLSACLAWDGLLGDGSTIDPGSSLDLLVRYSQGVQHWAVFDGEFLKNGFCVESVRPVCNLDASSNFLFWDDRNITDEPGTGQPKDGRSGCDCSVNGCRTWNNFSPNTDCSQVDDALTTGYGDKNTLNTWWFANTVSQTYANVPLIEVNIQGETAWCEGGLTPLTFLFTSSGLVDSVVWQGPSGIVASGGGATIPTEIQANQLSTYTIFVWDDAGCVYSDTHTLVLTSCPTDLELDIVALNPSPVLGTLVTYEVLVTNQAQ